MLSICTDKAFSTVHSWIERNKIPSADDAVKIADLLGVSVKYLCTGEGEGKDEMPYRMRTLLDVMRTLSDEDLISISEFIAILKKNEWRKKGGIPVPADADACTV